MDGYGDDRRLSVSVRNAFSVNSIKNHELSKTVKSLEAKRDYELLSLQVKKDLVISSAPGINKAVSKLSSAASDRRSPTPQFSDSGSNHLLSSLNREGLIRTQSLPPITQPTRVLGTPPRLRRAATLQEEKTRPIPVPPGSPRPRRAGCVQQPNAFFPPCKPTHARYSSPQASHKFFNLQPSSTGMMLSTSIPISRDFSPAEETLECQNRLSPRGMSSVAGVLLSAADVAFTERRGKGGADDFSVRPRTAGDTEKGVHRGLHLRPISSSVTEQKKPKDKTKTTVFSRLYTNAKQAVPAKASAGRRTNSVGTRRFTAGRRRSISMPDLSETMEQLKTCRYLRGADQNHSDRESDEEIASFVE